MQVTATKQGQGKREAEPLYEELAEVAYFVPRALPLALQSAGYAGG